MNFSEEHEADIDNLGDDNDATCTTTGVDRGATVEAGNCVCDLTIGDCMMAPWGLSRVVAMRELLADCNGVDDALRFTVYTHLGGGVSITAFGLILEAPSALGTEELCNWDETTAGTSDTDGVQVAVVKYDWISVAGLWTPITR